ncbi:hypothetical protein CEXT_747351 [Caerostris extrusa]|uniref:Uncharacterized protein n=1 Tax=Caerostris extrusa TaxID=172846 RepID=A0AAV4S4R6_CAEEX|nr:hypothetical protein CEXT_747351 [Caerostris extrusa]
MGYEQRRGVNEHRKFEVIWEMGLVITRLMENCSLGCVVSNGSYNCPSDGNMQIHRGAVVKGIIGTVPLSLQMIELWVFQAKENIVNFFC